VFAVAICDLTSMGEQKEKILLDRENKKRI
jgi:hypothetical protein